MVREVDHAVPRPAPLSDPRSGRAERRWRRAPTKGVDVLACSSAFDEPLCLPDQVILVQRREGTKRAQQNTFLLIHDRNGQPDWALWRARTIQQHRLGPRNHGVELVVG